MTTINEINVNAGSENRQLDDVVREHEMIQLEIAKLRDLVATAGSDALRANDRIDRLERRMDELSSQLADMSRDISGVKSAVVEVKTDVKAFGPRQELFMANTWNLITKLVMLLAALIIILGGLVGIKIAFPILFGG